MFLGKDQPESEGSRDADPGIKSPPVCVCFVLSLACTGVVWVLGCSVRTVEIVVSAVLELV